MVSKIILRLKQMRIVFLLCVFRAAALVFKSKSWLICERGTEARDNGYAFYKYMKTNHPERKVYYLITKKSADYGRVKEDAVLYNSVKSYWIVATCEKIISAHYASVIPITVGHKIFHLFRLYDKFYFLQHGVIKDDQKSLYAKVAPMRLFVCGARPEYDDVKAKYNHPQGVVRYTGLARFDGLQSFITHNQILVMPTWRTYISDKETFLTSDYYHRWQGMLLDEKLRDLLQMNNLRLIFYVHYEMQKYAKYFTTCSDNIVVASFDEYDVQTLLKESKLLITDYSSVFFDFAYMKKPTLFYQFDKYHYAKGYFDYLKHGFGKICSEHDVLIESIERVVANNFRLEPIYAERIDRFFPLHDALNCERIYHAIIET